MVSKKGKIAITITSILVASAIGLGVYLYFRKKKKESQQDEIQKLIALAKKEAGLTEEQIEKMRFLFNIESYKLDTKLQKAFDKAKPQMLEAVKLLHNGKFTAYWKEVEKIYNSIEEPYRTQIGKAFNLTRQVVDKLNSYTIESQSIGNKIKSGTSVGLLLMSMPLSIMGISGLATSVAAKELSKNLAQSVSTPEGQVLRDLYTNKNYSKTTLKLFNELWKIYSGKPFFNMNLKF